MYSGTFQVFGRYWKAYGGLNALVKSFYLHIALFLLIVTSHFWISEKWWEQSLSVLPNLLGFTLGGFAMFLSFGDDKFRALLAETDEPEVPSLYLSLCSSFVHFILLQLIALGAAIVAKSLDFYLAWPDFIRAFVNINTSIFYGFGYLIFLYSLTSMLAATMAVFRICTLYLVHQNYNK